MTENSVLDLALFSNDTKWAEVYKSCNQRGYAEKEPRVACKNSGSDQGKADNDSNRTASGSDFHNIHNILHLYV